MNANAHPLRLGIDLGGTKISGVVLDADDKVRAYQRIDTPQCDYRATCAAIASLVLSVENSAEAVNALPVGIGIPGAPSPKTGRIRNANSQCLNGQALKSDLEKLLDRPVRLANDADCFALSEARDGAGRTHRVVWGVIIGTGVGSGIVVDQNLLSGPCATAGEWGHNPLPWPTPTEIESVPTCWCGARGCIESWISGPAMADDHSRHGGGSHSAAEIAGRAHAGDAQARATLDRHITRLGRAMASVINILDPDVIVIGGGLGNMAHLYSELPDAIAPHVFSDLCEITLRKPNWGDDSGVRGAARLWDGAMA